MATIYEVSRLAGVSLATVSRVMNGNSNVREKTKEKVQAAIAQLNYHPSSVAKSLASNKTDSIGILVSELHGPVYGKMMSEIEITLRKAGKHVIISAGHSEADSEKDGIQFLINRNCDALILHVDAISDAELIKINASTKACIILINRYVPEMKESCIFLNNVHGGYLATNHLVDNGHKSLAYIAGPLWKEDACDRYKGHQRALADAGLSMNDQLMLEGDYREDSGYLGMKELLSRGIPFTGVACGNDEMAAGAMRAVREAGLGIPSDISLVGFDNIMFTRFMYPKLTTIHFPIDEMGRMAADLVMEKRYGQALDCEDKREFDPCLIERDSVANIR